MLQFDGFQRLLEETLCKAINDGKTSDERLEKLLQEKDTLVQDIADGFAAQQYKALQEHASSVLKEQRRERKGFEKCHYRLWKEGIDRLEFFLGIAYEVGEMFNNHYREEAAVANNCLFDALTRLQARAVHIGFEALCLLRSGYADGAHARWRTIHEIAVVINFLSEHKDVAKRYLEHEAIESYKAILQHQEHAEALGYDKLPDEDVSRLKDIRDQLCSDYGKQYANSYGWAAEVVGKKKPNISDIEKASGMNHLRPYYKMASYSVHAGPKSIAFRLGIPDDMDVLLTGPSNYGLADPAQGVAISIFQATVPMINMRVSIDCLVWSKLMSILVDC